MGDGILRAAVRSDVVIGAVFREVDRMGHTPQFGDSVVSKIDGDTVTLSRVFAKVDEVTGTFWTGAETVKLDIDRLVSDMSGFRLITLAWSGKPVNVRG